MAEPKIYVGNGKEKKFDGGGSIISVTLDLDSLIREYNNHGYTTNNGSRSIRIDVSTRRTVGEYGDTHSVTLNTWHPTTFFKPAAIELINAEVKTPEIGEDEEIPF